MNEYFDLLFLNNDEKSLFRTICKNLKKSLKKDRYEHTLGVAYTAASLAMRYNFDIYKALIAGLLHDSAKYMSSKELYEKALKYNIKISETEAEKPDLLHGKIGSYIAKHQYKIEDCEILDSIIWHTTGRPEMTLLDKIIYVADYIEPKRYKMPRLNEIRQKAFIDIDECLRMILEDSVNYLINSGMIIDDMTIKTYEYYK